MKASPTYSKNDLLEIARWQRLVIWVVLASLVSGAAAALASELVFLPIAITVLSLYFIYRLAAALKDGDPWGYVILSIVPCISLIALLYLNSKATAALRTCGVKVGLAGARSQDLENIEAD